MKEILFYVLEAHSFSGDNVTHQNNEKAIYFLIPESTTIQVENFCWRNSVYGI